MTDDMYTVQAASASSGPVIVKTLRELQSDTVAMHWHAYTVAVAPASPVAPAACVCLCIK